MIKEKIIIISGPTASGKSKLAEELAKKYEGVIINADSMQVYKEIPILSAQPNTKIQLELPHRLYGYISGKNKYSVGIWLEDVIEEIEKAFKYQLLPIIVGGTGLYIKSLIYGIAHIPTISDKVKDETIHLYSKLGGIKFHKLLEERDPEIAKRLSKNDRQRMIRAFEVLEQTGTPLSEWHKEIKQPYFNKDLFLNIHIDIDRTKLYERINERFLVMVEEGALDEVSYILDFINESNLPILKALGIKELSEYIKGNYNFTEAVIKAQTATRQFAKRQITWFKHQLPDIKRHIYNPQKDSLSFIKDHLL